ncbi:MAG: iron-sulfur binding hydrogenase [Sphaerochaetaceae bacterium]|jgi:putative NIF3 family GTP cyclohydrolase 1 type 2|nr:iron-sulfur binding hydrogenase [Sphaerochaetaceae bacterium]MDD3162720.1 iron-sulfur binding hydrogenase [Sphaerochaetaceae bacterium]MDD4007061.1 iron-sulfur binding hydrogenase [Sphaerochaetaceae bacterium]MDD4396695.1 iron-sulfur binding hydrogenase [Sphaerochaetaceae bacterium]
MTVNDITKLEGYEVQVMADKDAQVSCAYTGDLLSDVMGNAPDDSVLITIQAHKNTIAVASLAGTQAIVICNGRAIPDDMKESAQSEGVSLFSTKDDQFMASCKIASLLGIVTIN